MHCLLIQFTRRLGTDTFRYQSQMMTVDGWNEVVWPMCDANGFGKPFVFASAVVVIGGFVVIQLFTSVICATLGDVNQDDGKVRGEKNDVDVVVGAAIGGNLDSVKNSETAVKIAKFDTEYRSNELATAFRSLVTHAWFDNFIMSCIAINSLMMISRYMLRVSQVPTLFCQEHF